MSEGEQAYVMEPLYWDEPGLPRIRIEVPRNLIRMVSEAREQKKMWDGEWHAGDVIPDDTRAVYAIRYLAIGGVHIHLATFQHDAWRDTNTFKKIGEPDFWCNLPLCPRELEEPGRENRTVRFVKPGVDFGYLKRTAVGFFSFGPAHPADDDFPEPFPCVSCRMWIRDDEGKNLVELDTLDLITDFLDGGDLARIFASESTDADSPLQLEFGHG